MATDLDRYLDLIEQERERRPAEARLADEIKRLREALADLNRLRSNIVATQSASWSNAMYPLVAILNRAGFECIDDVTAEDMADHMLGYGGAGGTPAHLRVDAPLVVLPGLRLGRLREAVLHIVEDDYEKAQAVMAAVEEHVERDAFRWGNACAEKDCGLALTWENDRHRCPEHGALFSMSPTILLVGFRPVNP